MERPALILLAAMAALAAGVVAAVLVALLARSVLG
jgi:hypothetical protein